MTAQSLPKISYQLPTDFKIWRQEIRKYREETHQSSMTDNEMQDTVLKCKQFLSEWSARGMCLPATPTAMEHMSSDFTTFDEYMVHLALQTYDENVGGKCALSSCHMRENLKRCAGCFVKYCSEEHQRLAWKGEQGMKGHQAVCLKLHKKQPQSS